MALLRFLSRQHFPSDILAGALLGACVGYAMPHHHEREGKPGDALELRIGFGFRF